MEPAGGPLSTSQRSADEAAARRARGLPPAPERRSLAERVESGLAASGRWLHLFQDIILVAVALVLLAMGVAVLVAGVADLIGTVTVRAGDGTIEVSAEGGRAVVEVAENALLALILAELVGTLLLSLRGKAIAIEPFLAIAVVAVVRHLLFATVGAGADPVVHTVELLGLGGLILLLVGAVVLLRRGSARQS